MRSLSTRRVALKRKRDTPRRNDGRVQHGRIKARTVEPSAEQQRFHDWLRRLGRCQAKGGTADLVMHHLLAAAPGKQGRRDHWYVILLAAPLHNGRSDSVHGLGSEAAFLAEHGVDLVAIAVGNLERWRAGG